MEPIYKVFAEDSIEQMEAHGLTKRPFQYELDGLEIVIWALNRRTADWIFEDYKQERKAGELK